MTTQFVSGDLFAYPGLEAIAHGCNCMGVMGHGIAVEFKKRYPEMFRQYSALCNRKAFHLGNVFRYVANNGLVILNYYSLNSTVI